MSPLLMKREDRISQTEYKVAYLAAIVESSDDAIIGKDLNSIVTAWNSGAARIFGYTAAEMIGQPITRLLPPDRLEEEQQIIARIRQGLRVDHFETVRLTKSGELVDVSVTISPIHDARGEIIGASKVARDISERRRAEAEREKLLLQERELREQAEHADRIKNEFLATLSHELRTPLMAIQGWAQILQSQAVTEDLVYRAAEVICRNTRMQTRLVDDLLEMNRILTGRVRMDVQSVDLPAIIEAAVASVQPSADAKGIRIATLLDPLPGHLRGDPTRLQQIVWNLLSNAIKFTPKGGRVEVAVGRINSHVEISVSDTGIGIEPEFLPHVFDRFSQADSSASRHYGGLGLGLAIVKHLVELHGGVVQAKSAGKGKGSTFRVDLPLPPMLHPQSDRVHPASPVHPALTWEPPKLTGTRVLVVDDDPDAIEIVQHFLAELGAEVVVASSAVEALALIAASPMNVLISDIGMPEIDGFEFIKIVRSLGKDKGGKIPAIALTAFSRPEDRRNAMMAGFDIFVSKPVDPQELVAAVARCATRDE